VYRESLARLTGVAGLLLYNWWVVAAFNRRILPGPNELFSDLEASGQPYAHVLDRLDVAAGALILCSLMLSGARAAGRLPRELMYLFAAAAVIGGLFPYTCAEGISASCRTAEWTLSLPSHHYVHVIAGIVEFGAATAAIIMMTRTSESPRISAAARILTGILIVAYPALGFAYLTHTWGAFIEPVFFASFSVGVLLLLPDMTNRGTMRQRTSSTADESTLAS